MLFSIGTNRVLGSVIGKLSCLTSSPVINPSLRIFFSYFFNLVVDNALYNKLILCIVSLHWYAIMTFGFRNLYGYIDCFSQHNMVDWYNNVSFISVPFSRMLYYSKQSGQFVSITNQFFNGFCVAISVFSFVKLKGLSIQTQFSSFNPCRYLVFLLKYRSFELIVPYGASSARC